MKKVIVILLLVGISCKNNRIERPEKPDDLIAQEKMVEIIYDMAIVSSAKGINRKLMESKGIVPDQFVYSKHGIDSIQFSVSNNYYAYDIDTYQDIYAKVKEKLEADKTRFEKVVEEEKQKRDSLAKDQKRLDSIRALKSQKAGDTLFKTRINQLDPSKNNDTSQ